MSAYVLCSEAVREVTALRVGLDTDLIRMYFTVLREKVLLLEHMGSAVICSE